MLEETTPTRVATAVDEPAAAARSAQLEASMLTTGEFARDFEGGEEMDHSRRETSASRTSTPSSSEGGDEAALALSGQAKRSLAEQEATATAFSNATVAASPPKKRHLRAKVADSRAEDVLKMDAEDHAPVRKARVSVRTRSDSITVSSLVYFGVTVETFYIIL